MNGSIEYMKKAAFEELKDALKTKQINDELLEYLSSSLRYLLHYSNKYNIPLPENEKILTIINRIMDISKKLPTKNQQFFLPTESQQRNKTTDDETEPKFIQKTSDREWKLKSHIGLLNYNIGFIKTFISKFLKKMETASFTFHLYRR